MLKRWLFNHWHISLILLLGAVLRCWDLPDLPLTHDELSALLRTKVSSFAEFIDISILQDNHPGGVQLVILGIVKLFGYDAIALKLPFILVSIWSIWLIYRIGKELYSEQVGLFSALFLATLQYSITLSQWARPYTIGFALILLQWLILLRWKNEGLKRFSFIFCFAIVVALGGYTHYFTLLQSIILTLLFLPLLTHRQRLVTLIASGLAAILWLPHLSLTLDHLNRGGIGEWLPMPDWDYWIQLIFYSFHYSWFVILGLLFLVALSLIRRTNARLDYRSAMLFLSFALPYAIAYYYSKWSNPLLHQSVMYFALPFFLVFISSQINLPRKWLTLALFGLAFINVFTLVNHRRHFYVNYNHEYETSLHKLSDLQNENPKLIGLLDLRKDFTQLMISEELVPTSRFEYCDFSGNDQMIRFFQNLEADSVFLALQVGSNPELLANALAFYPCLEGTYYYQSGEAYLLSNRCDDRRMVTARNLHERLDENNEYSTTLEREGVRMSKDSNYITCLEFRGSVKKVASILEINEANHEPYWRGSDYISNQTEFVDSESLYQFLFWSELDYGEEAELRAYAWFAEGDSIEVKRLAFFAIPKNPVKFKLYEKFTATDRARF